MIYQKECEICGTYFETPTKIRKYCDACRNHPEQKLKQINEGLTRIKEREPRQPYLASIVCEYCGKEKSMPPRMIDSLSIGGEKTWDNNTHFYCCEQHKKKAYAKNGICYWCRKSLKGSEYIRGRFNPQYDFCSYACELEYSKRFNKKLVHICKNCGKEYMTREENSFFCSRSCAQEAKKRGWKNPNKGNESAYVKCVYCGETIEMTRSEYETIDVKNFCCDECKAIAKQGKYYTHKQVCVICKKSRKKKYKLPIRGKLKPYYLCSEECKKEYKLRKQQQAEQIINAGIEKPKKDEALCTTCKVSYKDCERMQSNFRILPEGAHYNDKGILTVCPKYQG